MPEVRFYLKEEIYREVVRDAQAADLTIRRFLQTVVEEAYVRENPDTS